jgi:hypothetical protein
MRSLAIILLFVPFLVLSKPKPKICKCAYEQHEIRWLKEYYPEAVHRVDGVLTVASDSLLHIRIGSQTLTFKFISCHRFKDKRIYRIQDSIVTGMLVLGQDGFHLDVWRREERASGLYVATFVFPPRHKRKV